MGMEGIAFSVFCSLLYDLLKKGGQIFQEKGTPFSKSVSRLCEEYKDIEGLEQTVEKFLLNDAVIGAIEGMKKGDDNLEIKDLVNVLTDKTKFFMGEQTEEYGEKILKRFFQILFEELVKSDEHGRLIAIYREDEHSEKQLEKQQETYEEVRDVKATVKNIERLFLDTHTDIGESSQISEINKDRIDKAKNLLEDGKPKTAKELYEEIIKDFEKSKVDDKRLWFRAYNNLASCELILGEEAEAIKHFLEAHKYLPDDVKSMVNAGLAYFLQKKYDKSLKLLDKALEKFPDSIDAICNKATIYYEIGKKDDAISLLERAGDDPRICYVFADIYSRENNLEKAIEYSKKGLSSDEKCNKIDAMLILGVSLLKKAEGLARKGFLLPSQRTSEIKKLLEEAYSVYSDTIKLLRNQEREKTLEFALVNRAAVSIMLGKGDEAIADAKEALRNNGKNFEALNNKGVAEFLKDRFQDAVASFEKCLGIKGRNTDILYKLSSSYIFAGKPESAIELIKEEGDFQLRLILVNAYLRNQEYEEAKRILDVLLDKHKGNLDVLLEYAGYYSAIGKKDEAKKYLEMIYSKKDGKAVKVASLRLADYALEDKEYEKAAEIYEDLVSPDIDSPVLRNYIMSLYNSKLFGKCLTVIKAHRSVTKSPDVFYLEIEASIYERLGSLQEAIDVYALLYKRNPSKSTYLARQGICVFRKGRDKEAVKFLDKVKNRFENAEDMMALAEALDFVGRTKEGIEKGYEALQKSPNDMRMHLSYMRLFLHIGDEKIEDKYIKTYQETINNFNEKFPGQKALKKIKVSDNLREIFEHIDKRAERSEDITKKYKERQLPLYSLSTLMGVDLFIVWGAVISHPELKVWVAFGSEQEKVEEVDLVRKSDSIILDSF